MWGMKPSLREALGFEFPPDHGHHAEVGFVVRLISAFPAHFDAVSLSFAQCEGVTLPDFGCSSEEIVPYTAVG